jgi:hypothetical protein
MPRAELIAQPQEASGSAALQAKPVPIDWHPGLSVYASAKFLRTVSNEFGWLGGFDPNGKLRCILPFTIIRKLPFQLIRFRVETIPKEAELPLPEEKAFLNSAMDYFRSKGASLVIPASTNTLFRTFPAGAVAAPYGSHIVDLTENEESLWKKVHSKHRNVIRNAQKAGVQIYCGIGYLESAHEMIKETLRRSRLPFISLASLQRLVKSLDENVEILVAEHEGVMQGCAVVPFSKYSAYYVYGGSRAKPMTGAMNLLHWEAMRRFQALGVERYDFVGTRVGPEKGTKQEGLAMFKERFGGQLHRGYIWKYAFNRFSYMAYQLATRLFRGGDIVDQEKSKLDHHLG